MYWPSVKSFNVTLAMFVLVLALVVTGLVAVYSASATLAGYEQRAAVKKSSGVVENVGYHAASYLKKQMFAAVVGLAAMVFFINFDYRRLKKWSFWIMIGCFSLCCLVWMPGLGHSGGGARRWIGLGPLGNLQPSELAKLGLIIYMAKMLDDRHQYIKSFFSGVVPALFITSVFAVTIVLEPDFGAAFVLCLIIFGMWLCGEVRWFHLFGLAFAAVPPVLVAFLLQPYRLRRLFAFFSDDPESRMTEGYQLYQSLIAIGSGGPWGLGLGNSMQKHHYLFAAHTDFIFAILAEELGFFRVSAIIMLFAALVILGFYVALITSDLFGSLLATGITLMIFLEAAINMCVVLGLAPTKGLVLPFISSGGSSLMVTLAAMGILMNIAAKQTSLLEPMKPTRAR